MHPRRDIKWAVYRRERLTTRDSAEDTEVMVSTGFATAMQAMDEANRLRRLDRNHSYLVGEE